MVPLCRDWARNTGFKVRTGVCEKCNVGLCDHTKPGSRKSCWEIWHTRQVLVIRDSPQSSRASSLSRHEPSPHPREQQIAQTIVGCRTSVPFVALLISERTESQNRRSACNARVQCTHIVGAHFCYNLRIRRYNTVLS